MWKETELRDAEPHRTEYQAACLIVLGALVACLLLGVFVVVGLRLSG